MHPHVDTHTIHVIFHTSNTVIHVYQGSAWNHLCFNTLYVKIYNNNLVYINGNQCSWLPMALKADTRAPGFWESALGQGPVVCVLVTAAESV